MAYGLQANTTVTVTTSGGGAYAYNFTARQVFVANDGASQIYANFTTTSGASTDSFPIPSGASISIHNDFPAWTGLSLITSGGGSASARVLALR